MVLPLPLIAFALFAKKFVFYQAVKIYGVRRLYKRMMEMNKTLSGGRHTEGYKSNSSAIQDAFRFPATAITNLEKNTGLLEFLAAAQKSLLETPSLANSILYSTFKKTPFYKMFQEVEKKPKNK